MDNNFIDYVKIYCRSGKGGAGSTHFRREKFIPNGGPDGGNGGRGGHIIVRTNPQLWTLLHLKYKKHVHADDGVNGSGHNSTGCDGVDQILEVPLGTVIKDAETGAVLFELTEKDQEVIVLKGGRGGLGNTFFKTSTNQAPTHSQPGDPCIEQWIIIELKVLADVGLVGFPNAGKSTLLSVMSAAKPEIANYPFTTLVPQLGMVYYRDDRSFCMADIPGIIEGASEGKGLGHRFLKHIERNSVLLFMVSSESENPKKEYQILQKELKKYNPELMDKKRILAITKCELIDAEIEGWIRKDLPKNVEVIFISSLANINLDKLKDMLWKMMNE